MKNGRLLQEGEKRRFRVCISRRLFAAKHFLVFAISTKSIFSLFPRCLVSPDPDYCPWVSKDEKMFAGYYGSLAQYVIKAYQSTFSIKFC